MLLAVDIGNTNTTLGLFKEKTLTERWESDNTKSSFTPDMGTVNKNDVHECIVSSVVPSKTDEYTRNIKNYLEVEPMVVSSKTITNIVIKYDHPETLGADRIADVVAAANRYKKPAIVIDFGTATTFNVIDKNGEFIGGAIVHGLKSAADSLHITAEKLFNFDLKFPPNTIATNTAQGMQAGTLFGYIGLVEGLVTRMKKELGYDATVIATGGSVDLLKPHTNVFDIVDKNLTLTGLQIIWSLNNQSA